MSTFKGADEFDSGCEHVECEQQEKHDETNFMQTAQ